MTPRIAPRFEKVGFGDLPVALRGRLVLVQAEVHAERDLAHCRVQRQVGRRGVDRIATEDDQGIDSAGAHVVDEIAKGLDLVGRLGFGALRVDDGGSDVPKRRVHRVSQRMHERRLRVAGDDKARAAVRLQIPGNGGDESLYAFRDGRRHRRRAARGAHAEVRRELLRGDRQCRSAGAKDDGPLEPRSTSACPRSRIGGSWRSRSPDAAGQRNLWRTEGRRARSPGSPRRGRRSHRPDRSGYCGSTYCPKASFAPARAFSRLAGSHWCHRADG